MKKRPNINTNPREINIRIILFFTGLFLGCMVGLTQSAHSREQYPGQYNEVPHATKDFYNGLKNDAGGDCCKEADCETTDQWNMKGDNYVVYLSKWNKWLPVPKSAVITNPETLKKNPTGQAIVCYNKFSDADMIYCFTPGAGL